MLAAQRTDAFEEGDARIAPVHRLHQVAAVGEIAVGQRQPLGDADHLLASAFEPVGDLHAMDVVDADDGGFTAGDQPLLDRRVVLHGAVAVEMVRRQVEQDAGRRADRGRKVDLVGRALDHVAAVARRWIERHHRAADIAAHLRFAPGRFQDMGGQRGRRRLAVRAGDGDEGRIGCRQAAFAPEQFDVADDLDPGAARQFDAPVRLRMRQRNAGRQHEGGKARPVGLPQVAGRNALARRLRHAVGIVVPAQHLGSACHQRARRRDPRAAEAEEGDTLSAEGGGRDHGPTNSYRSFRLERPISARITAMIQKRITTWLSVQPSFSK